MVAYASEQIYKYNLGLAFSEIALANAGRVALDYNEHKVTFGELHTLSNQIARLLLDKGIGTGKLVAIFNDKSAVGYATMIACLKTGTAYANLDHSSPVERLRKILGTSKPDAVVYFDDVSAAITGLTSELGIDQLSMSEVASAAGRYEKSETGLTTGVHGGTPAYVMFTSGSTGFPKGAVMSHQNVLNFIQWGRQTFSVTERDVFTGANPVYFDNSVFDFYVSIFNGATLHPITGDFAKDPKELIRKINNSGCTIWFSVPSLLVYLQTTKALSAEDFPKVKWIIFGGEGFPKGKLKALYEMFGQRITLVNVYGPTECTCICSSYIISRKDFDNMSDLAPLGFLAPNFSYRILPVDSRENYGELALIGPCVGLGYYNDPERTAASFIGNADKKYFERMYRTGDLVELATNGYLYFRGRVDNQVKHMGYRIELEEVEAAFSVIPEVNEVGVIYERISEEVGQIKAFVSVGSALSGNEIREKLRAVLPPYMIPKVVVIDSLPKNRNGKIDRIQLKSIK